MSIVSGVIGDSTMLMIWATSCTLKAITKAVRSGSRQARALSSRRRSPGGNDMVRLESMRIAAW